MKKNKLRPYRLAGFFVLCSLLIVLCACLQATMEEKVFEYNRIEENIISRSFSCDNSDLLIVNIFGGTLQARLNIADFTLTRGGAEIPLTAPIRADDNCVLFSFNQGLQKNNNYRLIIKPQAIQAGDYARMAVVSAVSSEKRTIIDRTGFDNSTIRSVRYGKNYFIAVGDSGKMSYSPDGAGNWTAVRSGEGDDGNKFASTTTIFDIAVNKDGFYAVGGTRPKDREDSEPPKENARMSWANTGINDWNGHKIPNTSVYGENYFGTARILTIAYGKGSSSGGRFVAAGEGGNTIFRWDMDEWRRGTGISDDNIITTLAFGNTGGDGLFIAGGYYPGSSNESCLYWAADGLGTQAWSGTDSAFGNDIIRCSAFGNGVFVIGGDSGKLSWSFDGIEWTAVSSKPFDNTGVLSIAFGSGVFIAAGHDGKMAFSEDGNNWTAITKNGFDSGEQINSVTTDGRGKFAAAGNRYTDNKSKIVTWYQKPPVQEVSKPITINGWRTASSSGISAEIRGMARNDSGKYIAVGKGIIASSANGTSWSEITAGKTNWNTGADHIFFRGIVWGGNKFVAVGYWVNKTSKIGAIAVSDANGENWTVYEAPELTASLGENSNIELNIDPKLFSVTFANNTYVAAGERGWSAWSSDGTSWTPVLISPFSQFEQPNNIQDALSIATDGLKFIVGGTRGKLAWSSNGKSWTWIANGLLDGEYNDILSITYGNGKFIAAGSYGRMKSAVREKIGGYSDWETINSVVYADINSVIWGGGYYLAAGNSGSIILSVDGSAWNSPDNSGWTASDNIYSAFFGSSFITAGASSGGAKIIYSD